LAERDRLNTDIQDVLDKLTEAWGIKVSRDHSVASIFEVPLTGIFEVPLKSNCSIRQGVACSQGCG
jgi:hypothetical protein